MYVMLSDQHNMKLTKPSKAAVKEIVVDFLNRHRELSQMSPSSSQKRPAHPTNNGELKQTKDVVGLQFGQEKADSDAESKSRHAYQDRGKPKLTDRDRSSEEQNDGSSASASPKRNDEGKIESKADIRCPVPPSDGETVITPATVQNKKTFLSEIKEIEVLEKLK